MSGRKHGTHACYVWGPAPGAGKGCRCDDCRAAAAAYERDRKRRATPAYVTAGSARSHVKWLQSQGVGLKTIAERSGVPHGSIAKLIYGDKARGMAPSKRIRPETRDKILAVRPADAADGARVPAARTWQHIDTLLSRGWTKVAIAKAIGQTSGGLQLGRATVSAGHARTIASLLDQPVPPRRSRHGLHAAPELEEEEAIVGEADAELDRYQLPTLDLAPTVLDRGACRRPDVPTWLFFPERGGLKTINAAKAICATCPVAAACLDFALRNHEAGVWGGTTAKERRTMRSERKAS